MKRLQLLPCILLLSILMLTGCSGSSGDGNTSVNDPFSNSTVIKSDGSGAIFGNISSATGKTGITLTTDRSAVDVNNGQVLVTARVLMDGAAVSGVPVTFGIVAPLNGPATIEAGRTIVNTDSNGEAITRITTGNTLSTTNVIVSASATIGTQVAAANNTFQIVRGAGVITYGELPVKSATVDPSAQTTQVFQQQIPLKLTDSNGNPRVGAPVTLSVYTQSSASLVVFNQQTVSTDASGTAIFNATVTMDSPAAGLTAVDSIIYKAATSDTNPIVAYAAGYYSLTSIVPSTTQPSIILTTDSTTYDTNDGSVLATAKIVRNGVAVSGVPVTFSITAPLNGPATIEAGLTTVTTDSNGVAITRITTGYVPTATNVIMQASATVGTQAINATARFQIVPTLIVQPVIILTTDKSIYDVNSGSVLATAKIVRNGVAVSGAPVTFSITAPTSGPATIEAGLTTVTTDSNGVAVTRITTGNVTSPTNVIVNASASVGGQTINATATFTIMPDITQPSITLTTDRSSIDVNNGQVVVTAKVIKNSAVVSGLPVSFTIMAPTNGPAAIEAGLTTVTTDSNGVAVTRVSAGNFLTTTNVIVQATVTIGLQTATATTTFQLVRGNGVIMFTDLAGLPPGEQSNMLEPWFREGVDPAIVPSVDVLQLLPFRVTDSNGNPRVGVPITLSVYSITSLNPDDVTVDFLVSPITEPDQRTITTDSAGMGIFNVAVNLTTPPVGSFTSSSVVFKATTNDPIPVTAYVGGSYSLTAKLPPPPVAP